MWGSRTLASGVVPRCALLEDHLHPADAGLSAPAKALFTPPSVTQTASGFDTANGCASGLAPDDFAMTRAEANTARAAAGTNSQQRLMVMSRVLADWSQSAAIFRPT